MLPIYFFLSHHPWQSLIFIIFLALPWAIIVHKTVGSYLRRKCLFVGPIHPTSQRGSLIPVSKPYPLHLNCFRTSWSTPFAPKKQIFKYRVPTDASPVWDTQRWARHREDAWCSSGDMTSPFMVCLLTRGLEGTQCGL